MRPSDCSRFICPLNETRISHYSLENPAEFSLRRGNASVSTLNGNPRKNVRVCAHIHRRVLKAKICSKTTMCVWPCLCVGAGDSDLLRSVEVPSKRVEGQKGQREGDERAGTWKNKESKR